MTAADLSDGSSFFLGQQHVFTVLEKAVAVGRQQQASFSRSSWQSS